MLENKTKFERSNEKDLHWENKMHKSTKRSSCRINVFANECTSATLARKIIFKSFCFGISKACFPFV